MRYKSKNNCMNAEIFVKDNKLAAEEEKLINKRAYLEKQSLGRTPDLQEKEPSISSPPIDLIASALADFRG